MYYIRKTKTASKATAVQIVKYVSRKIEIIKHVGSAHDACEEQELVVIAENWIEQASKQSPLFSSSNQSVDSIIFDKYEYLGVRFTFIHEIISKLLDRFKFSSLGSKLLNDLTIMRIVEPASKLESVELLKEYFGISHRRQSFYEELPKLVKLKDEAEKLILQIATSEFGFNFTLVFYDVTTLYFESFSADILRKPGFSKDGKSNQPQVIIGLVVNDQGFPLSYELFEGNKFEGHTIIPVIQNFQKKHEIKTLTVVADAAMISIENVRELNKKGLSYIVGARVGNLSKVQIENISLRLGKVDKSSVRIATKHGTLICDFSAKRYRKDLNEMEKQLKKAHYYLKNPASMKRTKFLKNSEKNNFELNDGLKKKTELILGIKGYYTNLGDEISNQSIIAHYHNLWHVEQAFRIAKSDLQTRPIFHFKQDAIKTHLIICFMALALSKYIEIKTGKSINHVIKLLKRVTDARMLNLLTREELSLRTKISDEITGLLGKLNL